MKKPKAKQNAVAAAGHATEHQMYSIADRLEKVTHFTIEECKTLVHLHNRLERFGILDRMRMRDILQVLFEITDDIMLDLAYKAFDRNNDNHVDVEEFVHGLSTMLRGTIDELSDWCYYIYDINGDGGLAREELAHCLKGCILPGWGVEADELEDCERDIVEITMNKLDYDRDGQITITDFKKACKKDPLLLVSVGPCLPPIKSCAGFLALVTEKYHSYTGALGRKPRNKRKSTIGAGNGARHSSGRASVSVLYSSSHTNEHFIHMMSSSVFN